MANCISASTTVHARQGVGVHCLGGFLKLEFNFDFLSAGVFEGYSELLLAFNILDCKWNELLVPFIEVRHFNAHALLTYQIWNFNASRKQNLESLRRCNFLAVFQEVFHAASEFVFEEILEGFLDPELFVGVSEKPKVDD